MKGAVAQGVEIVAFDENHIKGIAFNMIFMVWKRQTTAPAFREGIRLQGELGAKFPKGIGVLHVIDPGASPPDKPARDAFVEAIQLPFVRHLSVVHEGLGFKAASVRAIMSGVNALARPQFEHAVHNSLTSAAHWHAQKNIRLGQRETAARIEQVVRSLDAHFVEQYGK